VVAVRAVRHSGCDVVAADLPALVGVAGAVPSGAVVVAAPGRVVVLERFVVVEPLAVVVVDPGSLGVEPDDSVGDDVVELVDSLVGSVVVDSAVVVVVVVVVGGGAVMGTGSSR
jgi:hypothetical protein